MAANESELTITVEEPKGWARRMKVTVPAERVDRQRRAISQRLAGRVRMPGFRKGKVPTQVIERTYGPAIEQETLEQVVGEAYREALEKEGFQPITQGAVENVEYERGSDLVFDVAFEVRPQVELERLGGFTVRREKPAVEDEQVAGVLDRVREEHAVWEPVQGEHAVNGDMVSVEITALNDEGEPMEGAKPRPYQIALGKGEARPEVEEAIRSILPGEESEFTLELPSEEEGGEAKPHRARVNLLAVKRPRLPELDDELARSVGDFESLEALRARIREDLERETESEAEAGVRRQLVEQIVEANPFEVPDTMVENYLDRLFRVKEPADRERMAEAIQGARPMAERAIKRMLVVERVAEMEGLEATPADLDARIEEMAARYGQSVEDVRRQLQKSDQLHALEDEITEEKVFTYLKSLSTVE